MFMVDECYLLWGDICGYVWGKTNERVTIPVVNARYKQTYFGALDYKIKEFITYAAEKCDTKNTINFVEYLRPQRQQSQTFNNLGWCKLSPFTINSRLSRFIKS